MAGQVAVCSFTPSLLSCMAGRHGCLPESLITLVVAVAQRRLGPSSSATTSTSRSGAAVLGGPAPLLEPAHDHHAAALGQRLGRVLGLVPPHDHGIERVRRTPHLAYSFLRRTDLSGLMTHQPDTQVPLLLEIRFLRRFWRRSITASSSNGTLSIARARSNRLAK